MNRLEASADEEFLVDGLLTDLQIPTGHPRMDC